MDLPAVVINVMRIGTGRATSHRDRGDYWQMTRGGGHGDYRTIVLAPKSVQENADLITEAFDLSEKYRHPVPHRLGRGHRTDDGGRGAEGLQGARHQPVRLGDEGLQKGRRPAPVPERLVHGPRLHGKSFRQVRGDGEKRAALELYKAEDADVVVVAYGISSRIARRRWIWRAPKASGSASCAPSRSTRSPWKDFLHSKMSKRF